MTTTTNPFDMAARYLADEHHKKVQLRDQLAGLQVRRAREGDIVGALSAQLDRARLDGEISGLITATTQVQMIRERVADA